VYINRQEKTDNLAGVYIINRQEKTDNLADVYINRQEKTDTYLPPFAFIKRSPGEIPVKESQVSDSAFPTTGRRLD
jgi:hypothetical protein